MPSRLFSLPKKLATRRSKSVDPRDRCDAATNRKGAFVGNSSGRDARNGHSGSNGVALHITSSNPRRGHSVDPARSVGRSSNRSNDTLETGATPVEGIKVGNNSTRNGNYREGNTDSSALRNDGIHSNIQQSSGPIRYAAITPDRTPENYLRGPGTPGTASTLNTTNGSASIHSPSQNTNVFAMADSASTNDKNASKQSQYQPQCHSSNKSTASSVKSERSESGYESEFVTAFDRSPPSFGEELLEDGGGIFPKLYFGNGFGNIDHRDDHGDPPAILALEEDDLVHDMILNNHFGNYGLARDDDDVSGLHDDLNDGGENEWEFEPFGLSKQKAEQQQQDSRLTNGEPHMERSVKNPRIVSPAPSPNDDLLAWGMTPAANLTSRDGNNTTTNLDDVFDKSFFQNGFSFENSVSGRRGEKNGESSAFGFDDEGFGPTDDAFFTSGWGTSSINADSDNAWKQMETDPFKPQHEQEQKRPQQSQQDPPQKPPRDPEERPLSPFPTQNIPTVSSWTSNRTESRKIDSLEITSSPTAPASFLRNQKMGPKDPLPEKKRMELSESPAEKKQLSIHPLKQPSKQPEHNNANGEVVVSFEGFDGLKPTSRPELNRKVSHGSRRHRRIPSNGSASSRNSRRVRHTGSVGSNSSAVDQILEQYRQKRLAKNSAKGGIPHGAASVSSQSNSASGQINHNALPHHFSNGHRRNPSDQSLSKIIDNLDTAASCISNSNSGLLSVPTVPRHPPRGVHPSPPSSTTGASRVGFSASELSNRRRSYQQLEEVVGDTERFLMANIEATIGPRGVAPDMESLSGRSHRSGKSRHRHNRSPISSLNHRTDASVDSRTSRHSFRSYRTNQSALSTMSKETQSVANDLFRLEAQLAMVTKQQKIGEEEEPPDNEVGIVVPSSTSDLSIRSGAPSNLGATPAPRPAPVEVIAPPGKLGILLANKSGQQGPTHVSAVRSESVLAGKVHVGDRFVSIDGEDVTRMNSKEITTIMARKSEFERVLVLIPLQGLSRQQQWI